jgi:hypothetical protein
MSLKKQQKQQHGGRYQNGDYQQAKEIVGTYSGAPIPNKKGLPPHLLKKRTELLKEGKHSNPAYGWSIRAPKKGTERHILKRECGNQCFLIPEKEAFPICTKYALTAPKCKFDCGGLLTAFRRARQYKYPAVAAMAETKWKKDCKAASK